MKEIVKTYFSDDPVSAVCALLVFMCTIVGLVAHLCIGAGAFSFFVELVFCIMGWNLVSAVYDESVEELKRTRKLHD